MGRSVRDHQKDCSFRRSGEAEEVESDRVRKDTVGNVGSNWQAKDKENR